MMSASLRLLKLRQNNIVVLSTIGQHRYNTSNNSNNQLNLICIISFTIPEPYHTSISFLLIISNKIGERKKGDRQRRERRSPSCRTATSSFAAQ